MATSPQTTKLIIGVLIVLIIVAGAVGYYAGTAVVPAKTVTVTTPVTVSATPVTPPATPTTPPITVTTPPAVEWPTRAVYAICGWGVGGGTDTFTRAVTSILQNLTGVPWVVVNMPGASGAIADDYITKQPADGYTVLFAPISFVTNILLGTNPHTLEDYIPVCMFQWDVAALWIRTDDTRFKNLDEFIEYAKENEVKIGGTGTGTTDHINVYLFIKNSGIKAKYITYHKAGEMHKDLLGGHIDAMHEEPGPVVSLYEGGEVKPLFFFYDKRLEEFPDVPAITEYGWDIALGVWRGVFVRAGTPPEIVKKLQDLCVKAYYDPAYRKFEKERYLFYRPGLKVGDEFKKFIENEFKIYEQALKELGIIS